MAKSKKKLKVRITARQMVFYDQTVEMTQKEWEEFKSTPPSSLVACGEMVGGWIKASDIDDAYDVEDDFEAIVVDDDGKPVQPLDEYKPLDEYAG